MLLNKPHTVDSTDEILQCFDLGLDAGLREDKVVLREHNESKGAQ